MNARVLLGAVALAVLTLESGLGGGTALKTSPPQPTLTAVENFEIDLAALSRAQEDPPYQFRGGQITGGTVVDREGKVLLKSSVEESIHGADVSPDQRKVLVHMASKLTNRSVILEPPLGVSIDLPAKPPGDRLFPFTWKWLGSDLLFGISGIEVVDQGSNVENCANDQNVERVKFYTFDLKTKLLSEVAMPGTIVEPLIAATEVTGDGHVHLMLEAPRNSVDPDLGWFKVEVSR